MSRIVSPDRRLSLIGTSLVGRLKISYCDLVFVFGKPNSETDGYKVDAEWVLRTPDGVATIYNYKDGENYLGSAGKPIEKIRDWHIGGRSSRVLTWIAVKFNGLGVLEPVV